MNEVCGTIECNTAGRGVTPYYCSNEDRFAYFLPYVDSAQSILAVGSEQGLDLMANSEAKSLAIIDADPRVLHFMQTVLSVGSGHKTKTGNYPDLLSLSKYFDRSQLGETLEMVMPPKCSQDLEATKYLASGFKQQFFMPSYGHYLRQRAQFDDESGNKYSWLADDHIEAVFDAYDQGTIGFYNVDLSDEVGMKQLGSTLEEKSDIDCVYLSNVEGFVSFFSDPTLLSAIWKNIEGLPLSQEGMILRTLDRNYTTHRSPIAVKNRSIRLDMQEIYDLSWHYNVESFEHHNEHSKDPHYADLGWEKLVKPSSLLPQGFSTLFVP